MVPLGNIGFRQHTVRSSSRYNGFHYNIQVYNARHYNIEALGTNKQERENHILNNVENTSKANASSAAETCLHV
eukprot:973655-Rhodomonas_salina.1